MKYLQCTMCYVDRNDHYKKEKKLIPISEVQYITRSKDFKNQFVLTKTDTSSFYISENFKVINKK